MRMLAPAAWLALGALGCSIIGERTLLAAGATGASSAALPSGAEPNTGALVPSPPADSAAAAQADDPVLAELRGLLDQARFAQEAKDFAGARTRIAEAIERTLALTAGREDSQACALLAEMGRFAYDAGELRSGEDAWRRVVEVVSRTLPEDHPGLQSARLYLAATLHAQGDLAGARASFEEVLAVYSRTLPEDHQDLQMARGNLAATIQAQGDLAGARALQEEVLAVYSRTLPEDHPNLQVARQNLAVTIKAQGDLAVARALEEQVLAVYSRSLPADHPDLQIARGSLAVTIKAQGDLQGARALEEQVLAVLSRTLPEDHSDLQAARNNLAATIQAQGDLAGARALFEDVLAVYSRTLSADHPDLQTARSNLAAMILAQGDLAGARVLQEEVLAVSSRTLPADHPDVQRARQNLAVTINAQGDLAGARALEEEVLAVFSRTLPEDHPDLQRARQNLAATIQAQGDLAGARVLFEKVFAVRSRTLPEDHHDLQTARQNLAAMLYTQGDLAGARALLEEVLAVRSHTLPEDHHGLQMARQNLAATIKAQGDLAGARALFEEVLAVYSRTLPEDHPELQTARLNLALTLGALVASTARVSGGEAERDRESGRERCAELLLALCRAQTSAARAALLESSAREAQARCESLAAARLDTSLSFAAGYGLFEPIPALERASFVLGETTRGAALGAAALMRQAAGAAEYPRLREELRRASDELAGLAQKGTTNAEFQAALARRDGLQRELAQLAREIAGGAPAGLDFDVDVLAASLSEKDAVVGFRRYVSWSFENAAAGEPAGSAAPVYQAVASLCALVLRRGSDATALDETAGSLTRVELGPIAPIEAAVSDWRAAIGAGLERGLAVEDELTDSARATGVELRRLVFDPLLVALGDAERVVIALDDVLHLVPIEALPMDEGSSSSRGDAALVGERWRIETRCTLAELLAPAPSGSSADVLVSLGGASFNSEPLAPDAEDLAAFELAVDAAHNSAQAPEPAAAILRGGAWERGFSPLTYTGLEAREVAALHDEVFEGAKSVVLEKRKASRPALEELAPRARWLHVATHGWFAPESIQSWSDARALDEKSGLALRMSGEEQVKGMSPMLLCGLALAGANLPENELGRAPGLVTAEELSALDLSNCELVVLSACDTNVGERRAGQGVASLQMALQMAGAKSVITSLWKVPDEATRELMADFYRRLWVEKKPKHRALWEAKMRLRDALDERGEPRYSTRDWAAWVLTGAQE